MTKRTWSVILLLSKKIRVVSNASPLIYLAKAGQLHLLRELYTEMLIPRKVLQETAGSKESPDALLIASAVDDGWLHVEDSAHNEANQLAESAGIERGEAAAILLAREEDGLLLIDDKLGRSAAEILGVTCLGTVGVLLQAVSKFILQHDEFITILDRMIDLGFRLDSKVYRRAISIAKNLSD